MTITSNLVNKKVIYNPQYITTLNAFWLGFLLYTIGFTIASTQVSGVIVFIAIEFLGLALLLFSAARLITFKISNLYLRTVYFLYCTWLFVVVLRGFSLNSDFLKQTFA